MLFVQSACKYYRSASRLIQQKGKGSYATVQRYKTFDVH